MTPSKRFFEYRDYENSVELSSESQTVVGPMQWLRFKMQMMATA